MNSIAIQTVVLLIIANIFMTFAWYGQLKLKEYPWFASLPLLGVVFFSWGIALFEYFFQVPANKMGYEGNGGPFSLLQLKIIQEAITLIVFFIFNALVFNSYVIKWNHILACIFLVAAVYLVFKE